MSSGSSGLMELIYVYNARTIVLPEHDSTDEKCCYICGWHQWEKNPDEYDLRHGINVFNFERYKWGGVRHTKLEYAEVFGKVLLSL